MTATDYPRRFVPTDLEPSDIARTEQLYRQLQDRPLDTPEQLSRWLLDFSELASVVDEYGSRRFIDKSCHTDDEATKKRFLQFVEEVEPRIKPLAFALQRKYLESPARKKLGHGPSEMLDRRWQADVEIFRDENVPIETQITKKVTQYDEINGRMTVDFRGQELTLQQAARYLEDPDRPTRQEAWELIARRRLQDAEAIETIYDELLPLRNQVAQNAGLPDYRAFQWKANKRFDYTPDDCLRFADAIAQTCVPLVRKLDERRAEEIHYSNIERSVAHDLQKHFNAQSSSEFTVKVDRRSGHISARRGSEEIPLSAIGGISTNPVKNLMAAMIKEERKEPAIEPHKLRPWDSAVDPKGRPPLRPFDESQINTFVEKTREVFNRLSPELASDFDQLRQRGNLDIQSRKGKQPGGYLMPLEESRQPFIFMNAAGLQRDVETLLHEGGHAFHHLAAAKQDLVFIRSAPMEFCEVASMSMELLGSEHLGVFYTEADTMRAKEKLIEGIIYFFPWMAIIDSFQHWVYTHPGHTREERTQHWLALLERFGGNVDWSGLEAVRQSLWQRQGHLFHSPFYYVEYGIAQLGALQIWMKAKTDPRAALANYRSALALGGSQPLPKLFAAAGIVFDFSRKTLEPLMNALEGELETLRQ